MRVAPGITLTDQDRKTLEGWARGRSSPARLGQRAKIVLLAADGQENIDIASEVGTDRQTVGRWRVRFARDGVDGIIKDRPRGGRKPTKRDEVNAEIIRVTTQERPENATHWTTRTLAAKLNIDHTMV